MLEARADKDAALQNGTTALHFAAPNHQVECVRLLLDAGADKDAAAHDGRTALRLATQKGHLDVAESLRQASAAGSGSVPKES